MMEKLKIKINDEEYPIVTNVLNLSTFTSPIVVIDAIPVKRLTQPIIFDYEISYKYARKYTKQNSNKTTNKRNEVKVIGRLFFRTQSLFRVF